MIAEFVHEPRVAYFTMEIALRNEIPTYAGGLGILAGDTMRSAADLELPLVAVSLVSRGGYFNQMIDADGQQIEQPNQWDPQRWASRLEAKVALEIEGRTVWVSGWLYTLEGHSNGRQPVILLDTDLNENSAEDREITTNLYGGDARYRLQQELVLGLGGIRLLQALGFQIRQYHMNEGHSALLAIELLNKYIYPDYSLRAGESPYDLPRVRELCSFTTHTPVEAGHDKFSYELVQQMVGPIIDQTVLKKLAGDNLLNMTRLALNLSEYVNGVAKRHAQVSRELFAGYQVHAITNGVHPYTWASPGFARLYDTYLPGWCHEPELLVRADCCIPDEAIWAAHQQARQELLTAVARLTGTRLNDSMPILGFARRMTAYKRPDLLFTDLERLARIAHQQPLQIVMAGKAHPKDEEGKKLIKLLHKHMQDLHNRVTVVYLPNYDMALAQILVAGVDVWLNTPIPPMEASGTSGMKASFNGVPSLSVLDGWWIEGCIEGVTGWAIGNGHASVAPDDSQMLYDKLESAVLPLFYQNRKAWISLMKSVIAKNASIFNSHRMMRRYVAEAYL